MLSTLIMYDFYCEWLFVNNFLLWIASGRWEKKEMMEWNTFCVIYGLEL